MMPETMSIERRKMLTFFGAELVLTPGAEGMRGAVTKANEIVAQIPKAVMPQQFCQSGDLRDPSPHDGGRNLRRTPAGALDYFVAGVGTGGTIHRRRTRR